MFVAEPLLGSEPHGSCLGTHDSGQRSEAKEFESCEQSKNGFAVSRGEGKHKHNSVAITEGRNEEISL